MDKRSAAITDELAARQRILTPPANLDFLLRRRTQFVRDFLPAGQRALEIGAGVGFTRQYLPGIDLVTTDLRPKAWIDEAADAQELPYADGSFDASIAIHVLHHIPSPRRAMHELVRVVRPGGLVLIAEPHSSWLLRGFLRLSRHEYVDADVDPYTSEECQTRPAFPGGGNNALGDLLLGDRARFDAEFPGLELIHHRYVECMTFMNSGGVTVRGPAVPLPAGALRALDRVDGLLMRWPGMFAFFQEFVYRVP